nr:PREDICTED: protein Simiate [Bemisia tabaci]
MMELASVEKCTPDLEGSMKMASSHDETFDFHYPPIEDSFEGPVVKQSIAEQYFEPRYCKMDDDNYCILFHSNRICVVTLSKNHSIVQEGKEVTKIDFKQSTTQKLPLQEKCIVCMIHCADQTMYKVRALVQGKLIEVNENLTANPDLLVKEPTENGYLFIILPTIANYEKFKKKYACKEG